MGENPDTGPNIIGWLFWLAVAVMTVATSATVWAFVAGGAAAWIAFK